MKIYIKSGFLMFIAALLISSCEKALDNSIPNGTPRRESYNTRIKEILTNDSIWITQLLDKGGTKFKVGFLFSKDETNKLYNIVYQPQTIVQQLRNALNANNAAEIISIISTIRAINDAQLRTIFQNPNPFAATIKARIEKFFPLDKIITARVALTEDSNTFSVYGDFDASLTFFNASFLSNLKRANQFDFDFLIRSYSRDSVSLEGYYTANVNRYPVIRPIAVSTLLPHINAFNIAVARLGFPTELRVGGKAIATDGGEYLNTRFTEAYDNLNKNLKFQAVPGQSVDPLLNGITALQAIDVPFIAGSEKPAAGAVIAKYAGYNSDQKRSPNDQGTLVELVVK